jgi:hypothetical protein
MGRRGLAIGFLGVVIGVYSGRSQASPCDADFVRARAAKSVRDYTVDAVYTEHGIVTLLFIARDGPGAFAVALHAAGTRLFTTVTGAGVEQPELARVSEPVTTWWQDAELQQALAACCEATTDEAETDLPAALDRAADAALASRRQAANWATASPWLAKIDQRIEAATIPTWLALTLAIVQLAVLATAIIRGMTSANAGSAALPVSWIALLVIAGSAFVVTYRLGGPSGSVWPDTFNDQAEVQRCLEHSECTVYGMGTSVPGFVHAGGWLQVRDLLSAVGLSMDQQFVLFEALDALGVMLAAMVAWHLGGPLAAAIATWAIWNRYGEMGVSYYALYNSLPMPFLGAVLLVACAYAIEEPSLSSTALVGLVGAILANVHFCGVACGFTSALVGLFAPRKRLRLAFVGVAAFAFGTLLLSPGSWLHAAAYVLSHPGGERREISTVQLSAEPLVLDGLALTAIWIVMLLSGRRVAAVRRRLDAAMAIIAPPLVVFGIAAVTARINPTGKYIAHLRAPVAVALALTVSAFVAALARLALHRLPSAAKALSKAVLQGAPYLAAVSLVAYQPKDPGAVLRLRDIEAAAKVLRQDLEWDFGTAMRNFKAPDNQIILSAWKLIYPEWARAPRTARGSVSEEKTAVLLHVAATDLPNPPPTDWRILSTSSSDVTLITLVPSWIDWRHYTVCLFRGERGTERCTETGLFDRSAAYTIEADAMPDPSHIQPGDILQLRFRLRAGEPGEVHEVFMPQNLRQMCTGRIVAVPEGSQIDDGGRHATVATIPDAARAGPLVLEWDVGACRVGYSGFPPFFLEGDMEAVHPLAALMKKSWEY